MRKSELRRIIREEIVRAKRLNENTASTHQLKKNYDRLFEGTNGVVSKRTLNEGDISSTIKWDQKLYNRLPNVVARVCDRFPNDATSWGQATDEIADLAYNILEVYNELELDAVKGEPAWVYTNMRRKLKTPAEWNTFYKSVIAIYHNKLSKRSKLYFALNYDL